MSRIGNYTGQLLNVPVRIPRKLKKKIKSNYTSIPSRFVRVTARIDSGGFYRGFVFTIKFSREFRRPWES